MTSSKSKTYLHNLVNLCFVWTLLWNLPTARSAELAETVERVLDTPADILFPEAPDGKASLSQDAEQLLAILVAEVGSGETLPLDKDLTLALEAVRKVLVSDKIGSAFCITEIRRALLARASVQLSKNYIDQELYLLINLYAVSPEDIRRLLATHKDVIHDEDVDKLFDIALQTLGVSSSSGLTLAATAMFEQPDFLKMSSDVILSRKEQKVLLLRWMAFERYRRLELPLAITYIRRGGRAEDLSMADVATLYRVIPKEEVRRQSYPPLGVKHASVGSIINFLKLSRLNANKQ